MAHTAPTKFLETPVSVIVLLVTLEPLPIADLSVSSAQIVLHNCPVLLTHVKTHVWADVELEPFVKSSDIIQFVHVPQAMKKEPHLMFFLLYRIVRRQFWTKGSPILENFLQRNKKAENH